jgi:hypothetical protein
VALQVLASLGVPLQAKVFERAQELRAQLERTMADAATVRDRATDAVAESRRVVARRAEWRRNHPDPDPASGRWTVSCVYCERIRHPRHGWVEVPEDVRATLKRSAWLRLSHTYCPDCLSRHHPDCAGP